MQELVGKRIQELWLSEGEEILKVVTDQETIYFIGYGDCCSETWFADLVGVNALIGGVVQSAEAVPAINGDDVDHERSRQDYDIVYGYKLVTDKGYSDIVFRNSSNGYYDGSLEVAYELPHWYADWTFRLITEDVSN